MSAKAHVSTRIAAAEIGRALDQLAAGIAGLHPVPKEFTPTLIPMDIDGATVILVDDVLQSGRTVKAALDELFDHGRPAKVELAVLVDRGGRTMPVAADYTGLTVTAAENEKVTVVLHSTDPRHDSITVAGPTPKPTR